MSGAIICLAAVLAALLLRAAWGDWRSRDIPNWLTGAIALLAPVWWLALGLSPWPDMAMQLALGAGLFTLFAACFALGMMGGGDVKLIAAVALWLPLGAALRMLVIMAIAGGVLTIAMVGWARARKAQNPEIPYGLAIVFAGLWVMTNDILTSPAP